MGKSETECVNCWGELVCGSVSRAPDVAGAARAGSYFPTSTYNVLHTPGSYFPQKPQLHSHLPPLRSTHSGYRRYLYHQGNEKTTGGTVEAAAKPWLIPAGKYFAAHRPQGQHPLQGVLPLRLVCEWRRRHWRRRSPVSGVWLLLTTWRSPVSGVWLLMAPIAHPTHRGPPGGQ